MNQIWFSRAANGNAVTRNALSPILLKFIVLLHITQNALCKSPLTCLTHVHSAFATEPMSVKTTLYWHNLLREELRSKHNLANTCGTRRRMKSYLHSNWSMTSRFRQFRTDKSFDLGCCYFKEGGKDLLPKCKMHVQSDCVCSLNPFFYSVLVWSPLPFWLLELRIGLK